MPLNQLNPAEYNPRRITEEARQALKQSIKRYGITVPILVNKTTGHIVGGHQRYFILKELGVQETTVALCELSLGEEKALNIALNSRYLTGEFLEEETQALIEEVKLNFPDIHDDLRFDLLKEEIKTDWDSNIDLSGIQGLDEQSMEVLKISCLPKDKDMIKDELFRFITDKGFNNVTIS